MDIRSSDEEWGDRKPYDPFVNRDNISYSFDYSLSVRAIITVKEALKYFYIGPPLIRYGPGGDVHVDVPLMYHGYALDRIHYDPYSKIPSPKGRPVRARGIRVDENEVKSVMEKILQDITVVDAVEYRDPEDVWVVPLAWKKIVIAHVKVTYDGKQIVPDYGLTEEVRRYVI